MKPTVIHADSRDALRDMADASIDACVCDPPYALTEVPFVPAGGFGGERTASKRAARGGFMGKKWDTGETAFDPAFWVEVKRVLKPGAHLVAFGGTRTYHRLVCAIEDAGFEIRDQLAWLFGSGFPKSHNVKLDGWDGWGTALKPAHEPICLARKPLIGTVAANVLQHGTGALNINVSRIGYENDAPNPATNPLHRLTGGYKHAGNDDSGSHTYSVKGRGEPSVADAQGRWPANVIHDGSEEVLAHFPESDGQQRPSSDADRSRANVYGATSDKGKAYEPRGDLGSAARFFYTAKADADDRLGSKHPTVKPVDLMAYLVKLVTPPGGVVLDPFAGSGTTGMACMREGFECILIEREAEYVEDIKRRILHVRGEDAPLFAGLAP